MAKTTALAKAIAQLEGERDVINLAIEKLRAQQFAVARKKLVVSVKKVKRAVSDSTGGSAEKASGE
jgi:hypothetical protein